MAVFLCGQDTDPLLDTTERHTNPVMKKYILCLAIALAHLTTASQSIADEHDDSPDQKKKVPPGLQKKGGLPPGQAKKRAKQEAQNAAPAQPVQAPTAPPVTAKVPDAPKPPTPPPAPEVVKPATPEPPQTSTPAVTKTPETTKPAAKVSQEVLVRREKLHRHVTELDTMAQKAEVRDRLVTRLNLRLDVPLATIEAEQKTYPNVGLGGLMVAHHIARFSKQPADGILANHKSGKSWGEIAGERKVSLNDLIERMQDAKESARNAERAAR